MRTVRRQYRNPPVIEALAEVYFKDSTWDITTPGSFYERIRYDYPKKDQVEQVELEVKVNPGGANALLGSGGARARFKNDDETRLIQVGGDVLVVNQLRPYPNFEAWSSVLLGMLDVYRDVAKPSSVTRLGMRYINRIDVPRASIRMEDYFRVYAEVPEELGDAHDSFLVRLQLPARVPGHEILLTLGSAPATHEGVQGFALDLYDVITLSGQGAFDVIEGHLHDAHENVEWVFEHAITDATRAIFGEINDDLR